MVGGEFFGVTVIVSVSVFFSFVAVSVSFVRKYFIRTHIYTHAHTNTQTQTTTVIDVWKWCANVLDSFWVAWRWCLHTVYTPLIMSCFNRWRATWMANARELFVIVFRLTPFMCAPAYFLYFYLPLSLTLPISFFSNHLAPFTYLCWFVCAFSLLLSYILYVQQHTACILFSIKCFFSLSSMVCSVWVFLNFRYFIHSCFRFYLFTHTQIVNIQWNAVPARVMIGNVLHILYWIIFFFWFRLNVKCP